LKEQYTTRKSNIESTDSISTLSSSDTSNRDEKLDIDKFKTIESIACYLQGLYGFEKFKKIYNKVANIDERSRGKVCISKYIDELKDYLNTAQVEKHIGLFLVLSRVKG